MKVIYTVDTVKVITSILCCKYSTSCNYLSGAIETYYVYIWHILLEILLFH